MKTKKINISQRNVCDTANSKAANSEPAQFRFFVMNCYYVKISVRTTKCNNWMLKPQFIADTARQRIMFFFQLHNKLIMIFRILSPYATGQNTSLQSSLKMSACLAIMRAYCVRKCDRLCWNFVDRLFTCHTFNYPSLIEVCFSVVHRNGNGWTITLR